MQSKGAHHVGLQWPHISVKGPQHGFESVDEILVHMRYPVQIPALPDQRLDQQPLAQVHFMGTQHQRVILQFQ